MYELAIPFEVFGINRRDLTPDWYCTSFINGSESGGGPFRLVGARSVASAALYDTLIVPPTRPLDRKYPSEVLEALNIAHAGGTRIVSLCTGTFVLAEAGLLDNRRATTHWMYTAEFRRRFPAVHLDPDVLYVDNDDVLTSAGKSAAMDLCLYLVNKDFGTEVSNEIGRRLVVPPHRLGNQTQFMNRTIVHGPLPAILEELAGWVREHLGDQLGVEDLADHAHLSSRQLTRLFREHLELAPRQWLERERTFRAQHLLETTDLTVNWVASQAGFGNYAAMRRAFKRTIGLAPEQYRQTFFSAG